MANTNTLQQNNPASASFSEKEILSYLTQNGTIDLNGVVEDMARSRKEQLLKQHKYTITERSDGRWQTYVPDESCRNHRRLIVKSSREKIVDVLCDYYSGQKGFPGSTDRMLISMKDLYPLWVEYKALHVTESTMLRMQKAWKKYYEFSEIAAKPIASLTKLEIDIWVHKQIHAHNMNKHKYGNFSLIIRQLLDFAVDSEIIDTNPFLRVKVDKKKSCQQRLPLFFKTLYNSGKMISCCLLNDSISSLGSSYSFPIQYGGEVIIRSTLSLGISSSSLMQSP